jgi:hypothetical protein
LEPTQVYPRTDLHISSQLQTFPQILD